MSQNHPMAAVQAAAVAVPIRNDVGFEGVRHYGSKLEIISQHR